MSRPMPLLPRMLGEFFIIVVGVLVALFVDGLREERVQQEYERQVLEAVMADLDANLDDLAQAQQSAEYRARTVSELLLRAEAEILKAGIPSQMPRSLGEEDLLRSLRESPPAQAALADLIGNARGQSRWFGALTGLARDLRDSVGTYRASLD